MKEKLRSLSPTLAPTYHRQENMPAAVSSSSLWAEFDESVKKFSGELNPQIAGIIELDKYLGEPLLPRQMDPLIWWNDRKAVYPLLYELMLRRLCVPATSVPCERVFSKAGYTLNEKRTRMKSSKLAMIVFLNENL